MTLLAQQELLEPAPTRRVIVPVGHEAHWGIDPSTTRASLAWTHPVVGRGVRTSPFPALEGAVRLSAIYAEVRGLVGRLLRSEGVPCPGLVMIEQPSGSKQSVNLPLIYAVGVMQAAVHDELAAIYGVSTRIEVCTSSWWKKRATGYGAIYKPKRGDFRPYGVLTWARENGYTGASWDEADAWGIAEAARRDVALEPR